MHPATKAAKRAALRKRKTMQGSRPGKKFKPSVINKKSTTYQVSGIKYKKKYLIHNTKYGVRKPSLKYGKTAVSIEVTSDTEGKQA